MGARRRSERRWRRVAWSMGAGALYDLAFALAIWLAPGPAARILGLALPEDPTYLRLCGILLALLAALYALPWASPERYRGVVAVAAVGRAVGGLYLAAVFWSGGPAVFLILGLIDLALAASHAALLRSSRAADATP